MCEHTSRPWRDRWVGMRLVNPLAGSLPLLALLGFLMGFPDVPEMPEKVRFTLFFFYVVTLATQSQARRGDVTVTPMHDFLRHPSGAPFWQFCPPSATKPTLHFFFYIICSRVFILLIHWRKYENVAIADLAGISNRIKTLSQEIAAYICRPWLALSMKTAQCTQMYFNVCFSFKLEKYSVIFLRFV